MTGSTGFTSDPSPEPAFQNLLARPTVDTLAPVAQYVRSAGASAPSSGTTSRTPWLRRAVLALLVVGLPVLAAFGTRANWFSPVTGQLYTQEAYTQVRDSAYEDGHEVGYGDGFADGRSKGEQAGLRQGYADGRAAGYQIGRREGYDRGLYDGCTRPFDLLGTTRVMDARDYEFGLGYASYYTIDICR